MIFLWNHGYLPKIVDHIDHNTLNDKIENLREASSSENNKNRMSRKNSTSQYLGVHWEGKKWRVQIMVNKKLKHIGCFLTEIEAALAYNKAAVMYHKEFANLNIIALD